MKINIVATLVYLLLIYLIQLARGAIGGFFVFAYYLIIALPIISVIHLILTMAYLRFIQDFDSFRNVRGDEVDYRLRVSLELPLYSAGVGIQITHINPHKEQVKEFKQVVIRPEHRVDMGFTIPCPYIGVYTLGLEKLIVTDVLGWLSLPLSVYFYTMYVYPRVLDIPGFELLALTNQNKAGSRMGTAVDYSYFQRLEEYRPGQEVRLMAWKRFAAQGVPMMRVYNRVSDPGITLYLDSQRAGEADKQVIEREDFSLELMVSLAAQFLNRGVPARIRAEGMPPMAIKNEDDLQHLIEGCLNIKFNGKSDMIGMFNRDRLQEGRAGGSVIFLTHEISPELISIFLRPLGGDNTIEAIVNETSSTEEQRNANRRRIVPLGSTGRLIRFVDTHDVRGNALEWR